MRSEEDSEREFDPIPQRIIRLLEDYLPDQPMVTTLVWPPPKKTCKPKFVLREGKPELVVENGDEVEFCAPSDKELFICFNNQDFFDVAQKTIPKGGCHTFTVHDNDKNLTYEYWLADDTSGYKCTKPYVTEGQGNASGGGELSGGS